MPLEVGQLGLVHARPGGEAADEVHDRLELLDRRHRRGGRALGIEQVGLGSAATGLALEPLALALDDPGRRHGVAAASSSRTTAFPSAPVPPATSTVIATASDPCRDGG